MKSFLSSIITSSHINIYLVIAIFPPSPLLLTLLARLRQSNICSSPVWEWPEIVGENFVVWSLVALHIPG